MSVTAYRCASLEALGHSNIRLDCTAEDVRAVWKAETHGKLAKYLHDGGYKAASVQVFVAAERGLPLLSTKRRAVAALAVKDPVLRGINCVGMNDAGDHVHYLEFGDLYAPTLAFIGTRLIVTTLDDLNRMYAKNKGRSHE